MIKDPEVAAIISKTLQGTYREFDESARLIRERCDEEEVKAYLQAVGSVLYELIFRMMEPLYEKHPNLAPSGWNSEQPPASS